MLRSCDYNIVSGSSYKRLIFVIIYINVGLIFRAEALIKYPNKDVIINNESALEVLELVKSVLKFIAILIWI